MFSLGLQDVFPGTTRCSSPKYKWAAPGPLLAPLSPIRRALLGVGGFRSCSGRQGHPRMLPNTRICCAGRAPGSMYGPVAPEARGYCRQERLRGRVCRRAALAQTPQYAEVRSESRRLERKLAEIVRYHGGRRIWPLRSHSSGLFKHSLGGGTEERLETPPLSGHSIRPRGLWGIWRRHVGLTARREGHIMELGLHIDLTQDCTLLKLLPRE